MISSLLPTTAKNQQINCKILTMHTSWGVCPSAGHSCWRQHGQEEKCLPAPGLALPVLARVSRQTPGDVSFIWISRQTRVRIYVDQKTYKSWDVCKSGSMDEFEFMQISCHGWVWVYVDQLGHGWVWVYVDQLGHGWVWVYVDQLGHGWVWNDVDQLAWMSLSSRWLACTDKFEFIHISSED